MSIKIKLNNDWVDTNIKAVRGVNHVNSEDVYTKEETEKKFATKTEVQTQINNSITKENIENTIEAWLEEDNESTNGEVYTKQESDILFSGKISKTDIVQNTGQSTTSVMSQKAVSDIVDELEWKVTNAADEEDITSIEENGKQKLKFADRNYNPQAFSGKGYKILRKNIQTIDGVRKNILIQDMINNPDTIYEIRYDFDLNGIEIEVPSNCVLKFTGGNLYNGTLHCEKTTFAELSEKCITNIHFSGTINNSTVHPSWFNIFPSTSKENITNQQHAFDCLSSFIRCQTECFLTFEAGYYGFGGEGEVQDGWVGNRNYASYRYYALCISGSNLKKLSIVGNGASFINTVKCHYRGWNRNGDVYTKMDDDGTLKYNTTGGGFIYIKLANYLDSLEIHNLTADYTSSRYYGGWTNASPTQSAIEINTDVGHLVISHCNLYNNVTDGIAAVGSSFKNVLIQYCNISHSGRSGISLDTSDNAVIDNCNISYSGDMRFELDGYKNEGPGCAINSEPTIGHTKNLTISNCKLYGCAYTYISLGYTNKKANENVIINNIETKSFKTSYYSTGNKQKDIAIGENCAVFITGTVVSSLEISNIKLVNTMFNLEKLIVTNRSEDLSTDRVSIVCKDIDVCSSKDLEILYNETYQQNRDLLMTDFNTSFQSDNSEVTKDNKNYSIQISKCNIALLNNNLFKTNITGDKNLDVYDIYIYIIESRSAGICLDSNIFAKDYITNINNIKVINKAEINSVLVDYFLYRAAKYIEVINELDKNNQVSIIRNQVNRDLRVANTSRNSDYASYSKPVNFLKFAADSNDNIYFGVVSDSSQLIRDMNDGSVIINDTRSPTYESVLFSSIKKGGRSAFYGAKKGLPYISTSSLETTQFTPLVGESIFYTKIEKPIWWTGSKWVNSDGNTAYANKGTTQERPILIYDDAGFQYYDTTLKKYIVWNGTEWTNMDGTNLT